MHNQPPPMDFIDQIKRVAVDVGSAPEYDWLRKLAGGVAGSWYLLKLVGPWVVETIRSWREKSTVQTEQGKVTYEALWKDTAQENIHLHVENESLREQVSDQAVRIATLETQLKIASSTAPVALPKPKDDVK